MDNAWTWLKRANARVVCACCAVALVLVIAYWAWRLWRPSELPVPRIPPSVAAPAPSGLNLLDILAQERAAFTNRQARNPFFLPESAQPRVEVLVASTTPDEGVPNTAAVRPPSPPPPLPTPPKESPNLKYRGMLRRDDGTVTALIEDSATHRATFYPAGTNILGYLIQRVGPDEMELVSGERTVTVRRAVATSLQETPHVN